MAFGLALPTAVCGDVVELSGGRRLAGSVPEDQSRATLTIELEEGGLLTLDRDQIARVATESPAMVEYRRRAPTAPDTVESHLALAKWCQERRLRDAYRLHLERVIQLDPTHEEARSLLGYQKHGGRWLTRDQVMTARGMIRYEGDYRTRQEIVLLERNQQAKESNAAWRQKLARWRRNLNDRNADRAAEALAGFESLTDRAAGAELAKLLLAERDPTVQQLLIQAATQVRTGATVRALTKLALEDPNEEIRFICIEQLAREQTPGLSEPFVRALRNKDNVMVNRAAAALEELKATEATSPLIDALLTKHRFVPTPTAVGEQSYTFSPQSGGFSFGDNRPKPVDKLVRNPNVLSALVTITGENFGYDEDRWRAWLKSIATTAPIDLRRDS
ncbi:MAG: HEAT repeat domain-containing protein [Planctomycetota bacterium]